ncbi:MAG: carbohydrate porin [Planctomycetota bacterium]
MKTLNNQNAVLVVSTYVIATALTQAYAQAPSGVLAAADQADQADQAAPDSSYVSDVLEDPFGLRSGLAEQGITPGATLIVDVSRNFAGGLHDAGTFRHLFDFSVLVDLETLAGVEGATILIDFQTQEGQDGSAETGDLQAYSNIDADDFTVLYELWYEQVFADGQLRLKIGKIDVNADFAFVEYGGEFINSSAGFSPTILSMPTYPDPALGVLAFVEPGDGSFFAGAGVFDGATQQGKPTGGRGFGTLFDNPADLFLIAEAGARWTLGDLALPGRVGVGAWHHSGSFARFDGGVEDGTAGFYLVLDQMMYRENPADEADEQGVGLFAQYGWADADVSAIEHHLGLGAQWVGPIPGRDDDVAGLMASAVLLSDEPGAGLTGDAETAIELFYKVQITPRLSVKPDLQYILDPGGVGLDDAWVGTLRIEISY